MASKKKIEVEEKTILNLIQECKKNVNSKKYLIQCLTELKEKAEKEKDLLDYYKDELKQTRELYFLCDEKLNKLVNGFDFSYKLLEKFIEMYGKDGVWDICSENVAFFNGMTVAKQIIIGSEDDSNLRYYNKHNIFKRAYIYIKDIFFPIDDDVIEAGVSDRIFKKQTLVEYEKKVNDRYNEKMKMKEEMKKKDKEMGGDA